MRAVALLAAMALLTASGPAFAHHSITGLYDMAQTATIEGRVTKVDFVNPHVSFEVSVRGADGAAQTWRVESRSLRGMERIGLTARTVPVGSMVTFSGHPGRNGARTLWPESLETAGATFDLRRQPTPPTGLN